ncbi:hypothetical protein PF005_g23835 [Phytophthora fragariae]|uniref:Uncharacterized protein n=1 Tax=Phytophthora fragariae TaxID=53985 RepID=A0A6A3F3D8_9STRA|nr:hypothetical protein PF009_g9897 [Phytophthora fragariae]KAE9104625.1 hypothetical protein PF006_g21854 [Phytophthora fragariae]KAE9179036.1 hypothetical protein PF005_g23835 [Phytophthora fragariae]
MQMRSARAAQGGFVERGPDSEAEPCCKVCKARSRQQFLGNTLIGAINVPPPPEDDDVKDCAEYVENLGLSVFKRGLRDFLLFAGQDDLENPQPWLYRIEQLPSALKCKLDHRWAVRDQPAGRSTRRHVVPVR